MRLRDTALALLIVVAWGVNFPVIDIGMRHFPPLLLVALRFVFVAVPAVFFVRRPAISWRWINAVGILLGIGNFGLLFVGMHLGMPAGLSSLVLQSQAIFTLVLAALLMSERLTRSHLAGTAIASSGVAVIAVGTSGAVPIGAFLLVIAAALSWAGANLCMRMAKAPAGLGLIVWSSLLPPIPLAITSLIIEGPKSIASAVTNAGAESIASLAYLVVLATLFGFGAWHALLRRYPAGVVAPYSLLVPVVGMLAAWMLLGETLRAVEIAGALITLVGLAVVVKTGNYTDTLSASKPALAASRSETTS
jgi:O-acetylserine/cysteine efflux transporter